MQKDERWRREPFDEQQPSVRFHRAPAMAEDGEVNHLAGVAEQQSPCPTPSFFSMSSAGQKPVRAD